MKVIVYPPMTRSVSAVRQSATCRRIGRVAVDGVLLSRRRVTDMSSNYRPRVDKTRLAMAPYATVYITDLDRNGMYIRYKKETDTVLLILEPYLRTQCVVVVVLFTNKNIELWKL